jgi:hypothetical protein
MLLSLIRKYHPLLAVLDGESLIPQPQVNGRSFRNSQRPPSDKEEQVFGLGETGLFSKRMPFDSAQEKAAPGSEALKHRCTLLLGGNASGDHRIEPLMVYHPENSRALEGYCKGVCLPYGGLIGKLELYSQIV